MAKTSSVIIDIVHGFSAGLHLPSHFYLDAKSAHELMAVADYLNALRKGDLEAAGMLSGGTKKCLQKLWALDPK